MFRLPTRQRSLKVKSLWEDRCSCGSICCSFSLWVLCSLSSNHTFWQRCKKDANTWTVRRERIHASLTLQGFEEIYQDSSCAKFVIYFNCPFSSQIISRQVRGLKWFCGTLWGWGSCYNPMWQVGTRIHLENWSDCNLSPDMVFSILCNKSVILGYVSSAFITALVVS